MKDVIQPIKNQIVPICLALNLVTWILGTYFEMPFFLSWPIAGFLCVLCFIFCNFIRDKGKLAIIYYILFLVVMNSIIQGINNLASSIQGVPYFFWLSGVDTWTDAQSLYMVSTILVLCGFYSSSVYYFTVIRIRLYMLVVLSLIAAIIVSRASTSIIDIHFVLFILSFLALYIEYIHHEPYIRNHQNYKAYLQAIFLFVIVVSGISLIVPRPNVNLENDFFDLLYDKYFKRTMIFNTSLLKEESSVNTISYQVSEKEVFRVKSDKPLYLRIQTWDHYENNKWLIGNEKLDDDYRLTDEYKFHLQTLSGKTINVLSLLESMDKETLSDELKEYIKIIEEYSISTTPYKVNEVNVKTMNYQLQSFASIPGTFDITKKNKSDKIYYNDRLVFSLKNRQGLNVNENYKITYYEQVLNTKERPFQFIATLDKDSYTQLLNFIYNESTDEEVKKLIVDYKNEFASAYNDYTKLPETTTKRTYRLAKAITEGLTSDYAKAKAIEEFFFNQGYRYDMEAPIVRSKRDYIDYFLFRSQRGVCVQFASAMVVLARANGLPARYVEGYRCIEYDEVNQEYVVREKHGHAFPEVYISGYGWMVFEPTRVSDGSMLTDEDSNVNEGIDIAKYINNNTIFFTILLFVMSIILFLILKWLFTKISEILWRKKVLKMPTLQAANAIFNRMLMLFKKMYLGKLTYETPDAYARRLYKNHSIDIRNVAEIFNKAYYGRIEPTNEQIKEVFDKYIEIFNRATRKGASS